MTDEIRRIENNIWIQKRLAGSNQKATDTLASFYKWKKV